MERCCLCCCSAAVWLAVVCCFGCVSEALGQAYVQSGASGSYPFSLPLQVQGLGGTVKTGTAAENALNDQQNMRVQMITTDLWALTAETGYCLYSSGGAPFGFDLDFGPGYPMGATEPPMFVPLPPMDIGRNLLHLGTATYYPGYQASDWQQGTNVLGELHEIRILETNSEIDLEMILRSIWVLIGAFLAFCLFRYVKLA